MSASDTTRALNASLQSAVSFNVLRASPPSGERLEGVLSRPHLDACCRLLGQALGQPVKPFGQSAQFDPRTEYLVQSLGGIRPEQCLYLKPEGERHVIYAALWPWASNPEWITLHLGIYDRGA